MQKATAITLVTLMLISSIFRTPMLAQASDYNCMQVEFIWVRGSGQSQDSDDYLAYQTAINNRFYTEGPLVTYRFREIDYPAVNVDPTKLASFVTATGALASSGEAFTFGNSVDIGVRNLRSTVEQIHTYCPDTLFSIGGYSQGAKVVADSLPYLNSRQFVYTALFGEPKLNLPEGRGSFPDACRGVNFSSYNVWSPNCYTNEGVLSARKPYIPNDWNGKVGLWCNARDIVCGSSKTAADTSFSFAGHGEYKSNGQMHIMANIIWQKLLETNVVNPLFSSYTKPRPTSLMPLTALPHDFVFLIDTTGSMTQAIWNYRESARRFASDIVASGGRVALIEYRDHEDAGFPLLRCDFSCSFGAFSSELSYLPQGSSGDTPEGLLGALMFAYNHLDWRFGAAKSIVVLTDAGYHNPDKSGITYDQVVARSLEIDPVNTYILAADVDSPDDQDSLTQLTNATGGQLLIFNSDTDNEILFDDFHRSIAARPVALLPLSAYYGTIHNPFVFDATLSYVGDNYGAPLTVEWDFDGDSIYDTLPSTDLVATHQYPTPGDYTLVARLSSDTGFSSTISVSVYVSPSADSYPFSTPPSSSTVTAPTPSNEPIPLNRPSQNLPEPSQNINLDASSPLAHADSNQSTDTSPGNPSILPPTHQSQTASIDPSPNSHIMLLFLTPLLILAIICLFLGHYQYRQHPSRTIIIRRKNHEKANHISNWRSRLYRLAHRS